MPVCVKACQKTLVRAHAPLRIALFLSLCALMSGCVKNPVEDPNFSGAGGGARAGAAAPGSIQDFAASVGDRVFFDSDSTELTANAQATLDKQARWLNKYARYNFAIEGHADERGTREYNFGLGEKRAQTVRDYLVAKGVSSSRMRTVSFGKERPVAVCDDISCWSQNRRAVTLLSGAQS